MTLIYSKAGQEVYKAARRTAAEMIEACHIVNEANNFLKSELAQAVRLDNEKFARDAAAAGEGWELVNTVLAELAA